MKTIENNLKENGFETNALVWDNKGERHSLIDVIMLAVKNYVLVDPKSTVLRTERYDGLVKSDQQTSALREELETLKNKLESTIIERNQATDIILSDQKKIQSLSARVSELEKYLNKINSHVQERKGVSIVKDGILGKELQSLLTSPQGE